MDGSKVGKCRGKEKEQSDAYLEPYQAATGIARVRGTEGQTVFSQEFETRRDVIQGDIISPVLFIATSAGPNNANSRRRKRRRKVRENTTNQNTRLRRRYCAGRRGSAEDDNTQHDSQP